MEISKENAWGIGLMLIGVALAVFVGKIVGAICGIAGTAIIIWGQFQKPKILSKDDRLTFALEVAGTPPLRTNNDWKILLTNCGPRTARYVLLSTIRSEIGAYEIVFQEIPVMIAEQTISVSFEVIPRRVDDRQKAIRPTLWDFALDNAGERGTTYFRYDTSIKYTDTNDSVGDGGTVGIVFDLQYEILKTEGGEYWRKKAN
jgi:hypothetical protein